MEKRTRRLLIWSFCAVLLICVVVFAGLATFMTGETRGTITSIRKIYASEINEQIQQKFQTIVGLRLDQVDSIIRSAPREEVEYSEEALKELIEMAESRSFTWLGLYGEDGELVTVYGEKMVFEGEDDVQDLLDAYDCVIKRGINSSGEMVFLFGRAARYEMGDGKKSAALLAGVPMEDINEALYLYTEDADAYSHIIDMDGDFVIQNADAVDDENYFIRIEEDFETLNGKTSDIYEAELRAAMENKEEYGTTISVGGEERYIYCTPISIKSTWYLVTVMPEGVIKQTILDLDQLRILSILGALAIILASMIFVFLRYYRLTQHYVREMEDARKEAIHANKAKSDFLSSMSHDIRTPMNAIMGMTEIALKNQQDPLKVEDCLQKIKISGRHLLGLINDVLDMSKIESGKMAMRMAHVSLRELMDDIVNIVQPQIRAKNQEFDIILRNIISEDLICDGTRLSQVLLNLLSNAMKFTPEGGRIDVYVFQESCPLRRESQMAAQSGSAGKSSHPADGEAAARQEETAPDEKNFVRTHFIVEDNGIGMSAEFQKTIYDMFARENSDRAGKVEGTGLGMAITKAIVDQFGGTIDLQSEPGRGSRFHVALDFEMAPQTAQMKLPPWKILLVDDSEELCTSASESLAELGADAEWTVDGQEAVRMIEARHGKKEDYQFALIDWRMPGMDGIQTIREIRTRIGSKIPIFLISAYDWSDIEEEVHSAQIEGFISKPLFKSTLYETLSRYTDEIEAETVKKEESQTELAGKRILVAEDIDINWEIAEEILKSFGIETCRAVNGRDCVDLFAQSAVGYYDAILMDIQMPILNGYEATKQIRALDRADCTLPILAMTANAFSSDVQESLDCGMNAHIAKPLDVKEMITVLRKYL
ncbi:MAG: response regulator [Lachnospiraceae bacterium]|nr:response regulator [Lachnospiraceae bacterium]